MVVVGLLALLCSEAAPAPRKKAARRTGMFAKYIDPEAPDDPPHPVVKKRESTWLSVVFLIDRAPADAATLETLKSAEQALHRGLWDGDAAAVLSFHSSVQKLLRANTVTKMRNKLATALARIGRTEHSDLAAGLGEALEYMATAPDRKVMVLFTDARSLDEPARTAITAIDKAVVTLFVVAPSRDAALTFAPMAGAHSVDALDSLAWMLDLLHDE